MEAIMENSKIGCKDIAISIKALMTMANFMGHVEQKEGEDFRQYDVSSITGDYDSASMLLDFAGNKYTLVIHLTE
jgi:hypothetical protein